jgi:hypothetical protein
MNFRPPGFAPGALWSALAERMTQYCELTGLAVPGACGIGILTSCGGVSSNCRVADNPTGTGEQSTHRVVVSAQSAVRGLGISTGDCVLPKPWNHFAWRHWPPDEIALAKVAAPLAETVQRLHAFYSFSHHLLIQIVGEVDHGSYQNAVLEVGIAVGNKRSIDFQF